MSIAQKQSIADDYSSRFGNLDEVLHPSVMMDARFLALLQNAISTNHKLTRPAVESVFGPVSWEE